MTARAKEIFVTYTDCLTTVAIGLSEMSQEEVGAEFEFALHGGDRRLISRRQKKKKYTKYIYKI